MNWITHPMIYRKGNWVVYKYTREYSWARYRIKKTNIYLPPKIEPLKSQERKGIKDKFSQDLNLDWAYFGVQFFTHSAVGAYFMYNKRPTLTTRV